MKLKDIMLSEMSQVRKDKNLVISLIVESKKVVLWQYSQMRNQATLGGVGTQILFYASGLRCVLCLSSEQRIHRIFKRQGRASGYKESVLPSIRG
jgi:hypothetical protein